MVACGCQSDAALHASLEGMATLGTCQDMVPLPLWVSCSALLPQAMLLGQEMLTCQFEQGRGMGHAEKGLKGCS